MIPNFEFDTEKFNDEINLLMCEGYSCMDAILQWCEENTIEIESIVPFIKKDPIMKARIMSDANALNLLKKIKNV